MDNDNEENEENEEDDSQASARQRGPSPQEEIHTMRRQIQEIRLLNYLVLYVRCHALVTSSTS